jgi:hypothetical protein
MSTSGSTKRTRSAPTSQDGAATACRSGPGEAPSGFGPTGPARSSRPTGATTSSRRKRVYHRHGVAHYWILDPDDATLTVLRWGADGYVEILAAERHETVRAEPFEAIPLRVGVLFGDEEAVEPGA